MFALTRALAVVCLALIVALAAACGGGSPGTKAPNQAKIPTATLPATLPEPQILGQAVAQPGGGSTYTVKSGDTLAGIAYRPHLAKLYRRTAQLDRLSARESEVLNWIACGKSDVQIGAILGVSARTVQKHLQNLYAKLGVENRTAAAMRRRAA